MNAVLKEIRARIEEKYLCESCSRSGCRVDMTGVSTDRVIADADLAFPAHGIGGKRCDFVLFLRNEAETLVVAPIELKSGNVDASEAIEQLRNGARFADRFAPNDADAVCRPVLFFGRRIHRTELRALNRERIDFRGLRLAIKKARCGRDGNLARALSGP